MERAKLIKCPAPLPEEPVIPHLAKMLVPVPYKALEKKAKGAKRDPRRKGTSDVTSGDEETPSSVPEDNDEEEEEEVRKNPPLRRRRGGPPRFWRRERPRRGRAPLRSTPCGTLKVVRSDASALSLGPHHKYYDSRIQVYPASPFYC